MSDFSYYVLNVNAHDKRVYVNDESVGIVDTDLQAETNRFVTTAQAVKAVHSELFAFYEMMTAATTTMTSSSSSTAAVKPQYAKFHPPRDA